MEARWSEAVSRAGRMMTPKTATDAEDRDAIRASVVAYLPPLSRRSRRAGQAKSVLSDIRVNDVRKRPTRAQSEI